MTTPVSAAGNNPTASSNSGAMSKLSGNFDTFLTLLTTQLKNQDPTSPMDSSQFTQQLVQFSQVEQQIQTNTNLNSLLAQGSTLNSVYATSYLGKAVSVINGAASLADGEAKWSYTLDAAAAQSTLTVTDANGKVVFSGPGEKGKGTHDFTWDGKDNNGNELPEGAYRLSVTAAASDGAKIDSAIASAGVVTQIDMTAGRPRFVIGNMTADLSEIAAVGIN